MSMNISATKVHNMLKDSFRTLCAILVVFILFGLAGTMDFQEEERQHAEYCDMVKLWKKTGGQAGWPAYDGEEVCRARAERGTTMTKENGND